MDDTLIPPTLPAGFRIRRPTWDDLDAVTELLIVTDVALTGESDITVEDLRADWDRPSFDLANDAWLVVTAEDSGHEQIAGYIELNNRAAYARLEGDGYVHPDFKGRGIGATLLRLSEAGARRRMAQTEPDLRVSLRSGIYSIDQAACRLHEQEGYQPVRYFWRMETTLQEAPPEPRWPEGICLRTFVPGQDDRATFDAVEESFQDHWGHVALEFETWQAERIQRSDFDPTLWFLALDGEEIAGINLCRYRQETGWVNTLGVRRPWRHSGLGLALLLHSFGEFYRRGTRTIGLGVDAQNPTGATRLYERAGMHVAQEFVLYEKELRPGREI